MAAMNELIEAVDNLKAALREALQPLYRLLEIYAKAMQGDYGAIWLIASWLYFMFGLWAIVFSVLMTIADKVSQ